MDVIELKKKRFLFLKKLHEVIDGDSDAHASMWDIGEFFKFDKEETRKITNYLFGENLVKAAGLGGAISITHEGIKEVEEAISKPKKATDHFPPAVNIIKIEKMVNSQIQQSTKESSQNNIQKIYVSNLGEDKKKGYISGVISIVICVVFVVLVFSFGWNLAGQIFSAFAALFGLLGIGSLIKPRSIGQVTAQILQNIAENFEKENSSNKKK